MNYYPHHIGDYLRDTAHLSMLEDAAYRRMLDLYYASERPLPLNMDGLYRLVRAKSKEEKLVVDTVLGEFFVKGVSGWHNKRADEEILKSKEKTEKARASADMRWHKERNANAMRTHSEGNAPKTNSQNQEPKKKNNSAIALPDWVPQDAWEAWLEVRPKVKAPNTPRALSLALRDLERLRNEGNDPRAVLEAAVVKGWRGLFPVKSDQAAKVHYDA